MVGREPPEGCHRRENHQTGWHTCCFHQRQQLLQNYADAEEDVKKDLKWCDVCEIWLKVHKFNDHLAGETHKTATGQVHDLNVKTNKMRKCRYCMRTPVVRCNWCRARLCPEHIMGHKDRCRAYPWDSLGRIRHYVRCRRQANGRGQASGGGQPKPVVACTRDHRPMVLCEMCICLVPADIMLTCRVCGRLRGHVVCVRKHQMRCRPHH